VLKVEAFYDSLEGLNDTNSPSELARRPVVKYVGTESSPKEGNGEKEDGRREGVEKAMDHG
jgi:hypothetical protein